MISDDASLAAALRRKLYEGFKAHSAALGIPLVGDAFEQAVLARAEGELSGMTAAQVSAMRLTSERLVTTVAGSFDTVLSGLSEPQRLALKASFDPFSPAVQLAVSTPDGMARLLSGKLGVADMVASEGRSGQRFAQLRGDDGDRTGRGSYSRLDNETASLFKATGLSQAIFNDLSQRYSLAQIRQAAGLAGDLGVGANAYAGKFAGLDGESRDDLRDFVGEMRDDPGMPEDEKRKQIAAFRASHPKLRRLSDTDLLNIVNSRQREARHAVGDGSARNLSTRDVLPAMNERRSADANGSVNANARREASAVSDAAVIASMDDALGIAGAGLNAPSKTAQRRGATPHPKA